MFCHPQFNKLKLFFKPTNEKGLKQRLADFFPNHHIVFADSGRSAFQLAIQSLNLQNSEMLLPAYICDVFKPILKHYNIKPIYLDINLSTFNVETFQIEKRITLKTKSILVCHTYGNPVEMDKIWEIAKKYDLKIIEDCAHIFPIKISGDCAFFSFAKLFPVVSGGMMISKNPIKTELKNYKFKFNNIIKFLRSFPILARFSELFRKDPKGIQGKNSRENPRKASKWSLRVFNWYLDNFEKQISKRKELAEYFQKKLKGKGIQSTGITYISALIPNRDDLFNKLRKKGIYCSRIWYKPLHSNLPNTSQAAKQIINFPLQNWFKKKNIDKIISCI